MSDFKDKIIKSVEKFNLDLSDKIILAEAATGNYVVTPVIAAYSKAEKVFAFTRNSKYGTVNEVKKQTFDLAEKLGVKDKIQIITSLKEIKLTEINILTNTGFLRPINKDFISKLNKNCVIPLMWEPWEYRTEDLDLEECRKKNIKVYGTNEEDNRLKTLDYLGYIMLFHLLNNKFTPFSAKVLVMGCEKFVKPVEKILENNNYNLKTITNYKTQNVDIAEFNVIIVAEHKTNKEIIGENGYINTNKISNSTLIIHLAGKVDFSDLNCKYIPEKPANFGYMSFTTDFIDSTAVIDLHTAGLKVAEGMLKAQTLNLTGIDYKNFVEQNYPALSFENSKYW